MQEKKENVVRFLREIAQHAFDGQLESLDTKNKLIMTASTYKQSDPNEDSYRFSIPQWNEEIKRLQEVENSSGGSFEPILGLESPPLPMSDDDYAILGMKILRDLHSHLFESQDD